MSTLGFNGLSGCLPGDLLDRARVVVVNRVPFPPLDELGLPELASFQHMSFTGITFRDTIFIKRGRHHEESVYFHELVHVVQWDRLGTDEFLLAYGLGLIMFGYDKNPFEQLAYSWQRGFETGSLPPNPLKVIQEQTDAIFRELSLAIRAVEAWRGGNDSPLAVRHGRTEGDGRA